jgi:hypothetical protein
MKTIKGLVEQDRDAIFVVVETKLDNPGNLQLGHGTLNHSRQNESEGASAGTLVGFTLWC